MSALRVIFAEGGFFTLAVFLISFVSWTKMALGAFLVVIGAYFPSMRQDNAASNSATIKMFDMEISIAGTIRFAVVAGGIILLIASLVDGFYRYDGIVERML